MAKTTRKAGHRASAAGRGRPRAGKSGAPKAPKSGSRKAKPATSAARKQKTSAASEIANLKRQLQTARRQQQASAEILRAVADAAGDAARPLQFIAETTARLFGAQSVAIQLAEGSEFTQEYRVGSIAKRIGTAYPRSNIRVGGRNLPGTVVAESRQIHIPDLDRLDPSMADFPGLPHARAGGARTVCGTPLRREGKAIGALIVFRDKLLPFTGDELALLQSFADQAVIAIENARLFEEVQAKTRDLEESLQQQTATAEVLQVIGGSMADTRPVFERIVESMMQLFDCTVSALMLAPGDGLIHLGARRGPGSEAIDRAYPQPVGETMAAIVLEKRRQTYIADVMNDPHASRGLRKIAEVYGNYSVVMTPMIWEDQGIGLISVAREPNAAFNAKELSLLRTFADQAVIAIQNARLFNETKEALERQTATADILNVIASSPSDVQPVFEAIAERSNRLIGGLSTAVYSVTDGVMHLMAFTRTSPEADEALQASFPRPLADAIWGDQLLKGEIVEIPDAEAEFAEQPVLRKMMQLRGYRSLLFVPLLRDGSIIGVISVSRRETGTFAPHHVQLLQTFADQAVIAVENVRLFDEVQAKTRELTARNTAYSEQIDHQSATIEILKAMSASPGDAQPVFDVIVRRAMQICSADIAVVLELQDAIVHLQAIAIDESSTSSEVVDAYQKIFPQPPSRDSVALRAIFHGEIIHIPNMAEDLELSQASRDIGPKGALAIPLLRDGRVIGSIGLSAKVVGGFSEAQIELLKTFAEQAVIAIRSAETFRQLHARTSELSESLQQQTATADVLKVISRSAFDLGAVFDTLARSAADLCAVSLCGLHIREGDFLICRGYAGASKEQQDFVRQLRIPVNDSNYVMTRVLSSGEIANIADFDKATVATRAFQKILRFKALLMVPMMREGQGIGLFVLGRDSAGEFSQRHIELVQTFADQAVIAIENVRLFDEVQAKTRDLTESLQQQTATADVLKVISRSAFDLNSVMNTLTRSAAELCKAELSALYLRDGDVMIARGMAGVDGTRMDFLRDTPLRIDDSGSGKALQTGSILNMADVERDGTETTRKFGKTLGFNSILFVPLMREGRGIGVFALGRKRTGKYSQREVDLLQTFADQAVIAIENARLFDEVQARTRELSKSLDDLRTAQDRLVQTEKLASLGQLTAGIAHEIKNPLNFVNNFAALSAELTDELDETLAPAPLDAKMRDDVGELTGMLKSNLEKVVQHGKRADSIVKNMLQHSREGSSERRASDLNALVSESLNLAYHGARAERSDFNITLEQDLDPDAGAVDVYPQELTRALLNLISNGFYAAIRRKKEADSNSFEPVLSAATKNAGNAVEIRIRDNGTGIPPEIREKIFNPFFTTKPTGEGTGLGLSMTHDIIVKQHGGRIDVATEPGAFTEFIVTLPRVNGNTVAPKSE